MRDGPFHEVTLIKIENDTEKIPQNWLWNHGMIPLLKIGSIRLVEHTSYNKKWTSLKSAV